MPDIFDVTDEMRRKIPEIIKGGQDFIDYVKKNFLLIEKKDLLESAISHMDNVVSMLQTAVIALFIYYQNTHSEEAYNQMGLHIRKCELLKSFVDNLTQNGNQLEKVQIVKLLEEQVNDEPKLLNNLLTYVELCMLSDENDSDE